jgi:hypothetical protein
MKKNLVSSLKKLKFDAELFKNMDECAICMEQFNEESEVTLLPCDMRHYFHATCIHEWLKIENACPLCKKKILPEELEKFNKNLEEKL